MYQVYFKNQNNDLCLLNNETDSINGILPNDFVNDLEDKKLNFPYNFVRIKYQGKKYIISISNLIIYFED
jgi:hypothetical protein